MTAAKAISAIEQAMLAYEFSANSYTYSVLQACLLAQEAISISLSNLSVGKNEQTRSNELRG